MAEASLTLAERMDQFYRFIEQKEILLAELARAEGEQRDNLVTVYRNLIKSIDVRLACLRSKIEFLDFLGCETG